LPGNHIIENQLAAIAGVLVDAWLEIFPEHSLFSAQSRVSTARGDPIGFARLDVFLESAPLSSVALGLPDDATELEVGHRIAGLGESFAAKAARGHDEKDWQ
jgi:hypothetical protein